MCVPSVLPLERAVAASSLTVCSHLVSPCTALPGGHPPLRTCRPSSVLAHRRQLCTITIIQNILRFSTPVTYCRRKAHQLATAKPESIGYRLERHRYSVSPTGGGIPNVMCPLERHHYPLLPTGGGSLGPFILITL